MKLPEAKSAQELKLKTSDAVDFITRRIFEFKKIELKKLTLYKLGEREKVKAQLDALQDYFFWKARKRKF